MGGTSLGALQGLLPSGRPRVPGTAPTDPLPIATGSVELQRKLAPGAGLFLEPSLSKALADSHVGPLRWTLFVSSSNELRALTPLVRTSDSAVVACGALDASEEARVRRVTLAHLSGCAVFVAREAAGVAAAAAAAAAGTGVRRDASTPELGPDDVVIPPGFDSDAKIQALIDAEGLPADVLDEPADGPLPPWAAVPPVEVASGDDPAAMQKAAAEDERRWRTGLKAVSLPTQANRAEGKGDGAGQGSDKSVKSEASKSDFFLRMLGK